jgi:hypothetical protein
MPFQPSLMFVGKAGVCSSKALFDVTLKDGLLALATNLSGTNTSLLRKSVNYGRKKFHNIGPRKRRVPELVPTDDEDMTDSH